LAQQPSVIGVTLDTSVYIGALNSRGFGSDLLMMAAAGEIRIDTSEAILSETFRVLREKFRWDPYRLHDVSRRLSSLTHCVTPSIVLDVVKEDPPDNRVLECAIEAGSSVILTWDKDLLRIRTYNGIEIRTPAQFLRHSPTL
jgi:uncharacterized protein